MKQDKILWVTNTLGCGGAERQILYMYNILKEHCGFDITILYYAHANDELCTDAVNTVYIDKNNIGKLNTVIQIVKFIKKNNIGIVHAFGGGTANIYGRLGAMFCKTAIPVGAMLGKKHFANKGIALANSLLNLFGNWWTVNNMDLVPILKKDLLYVNDKKIRMLHNGYLPAEAIDYNLDENTEYDEDKRDQFVFTVVGRLQPVKNYPLFLKAAAQIAKEHANVRFWVVGNGQEFNKLQILAQNLGIADRVRFWGYRTDVDVAMSRTDVFVQTSFTEGSPNTVIEAMRAKKPIITTESTDFGEMIESGKNGYIVENDNLDELVKAMREMLHKSKRQLANAGNLSYEMFEKYFLDVHVAAEFEAFYSEVLGK